MTKVNAREPVDFDRVFNDEIAAINFRRQKLKDGTVARIRKDAAAKQAGGAAPGQPVAPDKPYAVERARVEVVGTSDDGANPQISVRSQLTGLALSGGGMRSASFSLGVLQALDSLAANDQPQVIDALDYISTVSGGGYIGTSLVAGMMDGDHSFPFTSRLDSEETPEVQHLRDFSSFLAPNGFIDLVTGVVFIVRGLLINALIALPFLLLLAWLTITWNPTIASLDVADVVGFPVDNWFPLVPRFGNFTVTVYAALVAAVVLIVSAFVFNGGPLRQREWFGRILAGAVIAVAVVAIFEAQPFVLKSLVCVQDEIGKIYPECLATATAGPADANGTTDAAGHGVLADILGAIGAIVPQIAAILGPAALLLISFGQKLANVAKATVGDARWQTFVQRYGSRVMLAVAAVVVPLVLWIVYLYLSLWAVANPPSGAAALGCGPFTPKWLAAVSSCDNSPIAAAFGGNPVADFYAALGLVLLLMWGFLLGPNVNSMHRYYRDRLSRAFLLERDRLRDPEHRGRMSPTVVDRKTFEELKPIKPAAADADITEKSFEDTAALAPYLLVNTAINIDGSEKLNRRGRNADTFLFSPLYVGSRSTRYVREADLRTQVPDLTVGTAMAVSGAAASANMGRLTIRPLIFSLALLNVRLGYWLVNPGRLGAFRKWINGVRSNVGLWYFGREALGTLDERGLQVYLTDGGHVENLGVYELIRRRCKVIIAVDVDLDPLMNFPSLVGLEIMARIDLGARIEVPWRDLQAVGTKVTDKDLHGVPNETYPGGRGPHAAIGIIRYDGDDSTEKTGVLIHIKTMLTGDENDYILDYKRRNPTFPHETTIDQFYDEEQFEVYRALGFHAARQLFTGKEPAAQLAKPPPGWTQTVGEALRLLNIPEQMVKDMLARIKDGDAQTQEATDGVVEDAAGAEAKPASAPAGRKRPTGTSKRAGPD